LLTLEKGEGSKTAARIKRIEVGKGLQMKVGRPGGGAYKKTRTVVPLHNDELIGSQRAQKVKKTKGVAT